MEESLSNPSLPSLEELFHQVNAQHFDSGLEPPKLVWNNRLRTSAGRFVPGHRRYFTEHPPKIEVAAYLANQPNGLAKVVDTLGHEMIHYWLWCRRQPYGHTEKFLSKMQEMGVSRYNDSPHKKNRALTYACVSCKQEFRMRRRAHRKLACAECCKKHGDGTFDERFILRKVTETK